MLLQGVDGENQDSVEKTGQDRTFPDIGVMQITDGRQEGEDRLKAGVRCQRTEVRCQTKQRGYSLVKELLAKPQRLVREEQHGKC